MTIAKNLAFTIFFACSVALTSTSAAPEKAYRFGVFPYLSPARMDTIFAPVSRELSASLQRQVKFRTSSNLPRFKQNLAAGSYDFVIIQPILYPFAVDKLGYIPVVRVKEPVHAVVMVLANSPLRSIDDLRGKTIATPPVNGPVVKLVRRHLREHGIAADSEVTFIANKTVGACLQQVLVAQVDACIAPNFAVAPFERSMGVTLRELVITEGIPNRALVVHPRMSQSDREKIRDTALAWGLSSAGRALLQSMNTEGFVEFADSEYDIVRAFAREQGN